MLFDLFIDSNQSNLERVHSYWSALFNPPKLVQIALWLFALNTASNLDWMIVISHKIDRKSLISIDQRLWPVKAAQQISSQMLSTLDEGIHEQFLPFGQHLMIQLEFRNSFEPKIN